MLAHCRLSASRLLARRPKGTSCPVALQRPSIFPANALIYVFVGPLSSFGWNVVGRNRGSCLTDKLISDLPFTHCILPLSRDPRCALSVGVFSLSALSCRSSSCCFVCAIVWRVAQALSRLPGLGAATAAHDATAFSSRRHSAYLLRLSA